MKSTESSHERQLDVGHVADADLAIDGVDSTILSHTAVSLSSEIDLSVSSGRYPLRTKLMQTAWQLVVAGYRGVGFVIERCLGLVSLVVILSILASIPILQLLSLGYLLEASGRVSRTGRIRHGFVGIPLAARLGGIGCGVMLSMLPIRLASSMWTSSWLLNGSDHRQTRIWGIVVALFCVLTMCHIAWAAFRGGRIRHFLWPAPWRLRQRWKAGGMYDEAAAKLERLVARLRLPYFFRLGFHGFVGAVAWLVLPISTMALATRLESPQLAGVVAVGSGIALAWVLTYLPFLQARLPLTQRFRSQFEVRRVRTLFRQAPLAYAIAVVTTLVLSVPLYLLKAELIPREAYWLPSLFFVTFMFPARILVGWALGRSETRNTDRHWLSRWGARLAIIPTVLIYALIVYFTQFTSWNGTLSLYEQHAFLVPVPFLGL